MFALRSFSRKSTTSARRKGLRKLRIALFAFLFSASAFAILTSAGDQIWHLGQPGVVGTPANFDSFGTSVAGGDFDGDGYDDLATGVSADWGSEIGATVGYAPGWVSIIYGGPGGLNSARSQLIDQNDLPLNEQAEDGDRFGYALAAGDFDNDGRDDLAIGAPGDSHDAGSIFLLFGSDEGLRTEGARHFARRCWQFLQLCSQPDALNFDATFFGDVLTTGDVNGDQFTDLIVGVQSYDHLDAIEIGIGGQWTFEGFVDVGVLEVFTGGPDGLSDVSPERRTRYFEYELDSVVGGCSVFPSCSDRFGAAVAAGDINGDGFDDVAIGAPGFNHGLIFLSGTAYVIYGSSTGLRTDGTQRWEQESDGIAGGAELNDKFGSSLAIGDFDGDHFDDLAVGVPNESVGTGFSETPFAGMVNVLYGTSGGLTAERNRTWHQDSGGIAGSAELGDTFGFSLVAADFSGDGISDLAVGVPRENITIDGFLDIPVPKSDAGMVNVIYGSPAGLTATGDQAWHQDRPSIAGAVEHYDHLGWSLASGDFDANGAADLAIGVPGEDINNNILDWNEGAVNVLYSSPGNRPPVADAGDDRSVFVHHDCESVVVLDGTRSYDLDGHEISYRWQWDAGSETGVNPPALLPAGNHEISLVVSDDTLESLPDTVIVVVDDTAPSISCPQDAVAEASGPAGTHVDLGMPIVEGGECVGVDVSSDAPGLFSPGQTDVTWSARNIDEMLDPDTGEYTHLEDACLQAITVADTTAPTVQAPADARIKAPQYAPPADIGTATATDAVGVALIYNDAPWIFAEGPTTVTWYAIDEAGNIGSDTQVVTGVTKGGGAVNLVWLFLLFGLAGLRRVIGRTG